MESTLADEEEVIEYTQEEIDAAVESAVEAALADVIDDYVTSEELVEYVVDSFLVLCRPSGRPTLKEQLPKGGHPSSK